MIPATSPAFASSPPSAALIPWQPRAPSLCHRTFPESNTSSSTLPPRPCINAFRAGFRRLLPLFSLPLPRTRVSAPLGTPAQPRVRVAACKWNGRSWKQNSGKLKLMNNLASLHPRPSSFSTPRNRPPGYATQDQRETVAEQRGDGAATAAGEETRRPEDRGASFLFLFLLPLYFGAFAASFVSCYRRQMLF